MTLEATIRSCAATAAAAGDWAAVAASLNAPVGTPRAGKWQYLEVLAVLGEAEFRHTLEVMRADTIGRRGVELLELPEQAGGGLDFSHPLTAALIMRLASALRPGVAVRLMGLGTITRRSGLAIDVSPAECQAAWSAAVIQSRVTNAAALAAERLSPADSDTVRRSKWAQAWEDAQ